ncbi:hypothetical protein G6F63_014210 [Rhizopus arrhizus]|nr:hypothetical protein G6F63_014210 [Rhizopus arrhizus]
MPLTLHGPCFQVVPKLTLSFGVPMQLVTSQLPWDVAPLQVQLQLARADLEGLADVGVDTADARGTGIHVAGVDGQDGAAVGHAIEVIAVTQHVAGKDGVVGVALDDLVGALDLPCLLDSSGFSSLFGLVMIATELAPHSLAAPPLIWQRTGSTAEEKAARPPSPFSAGLGARKPSA